MMKVFSVRFLVFTAFSFILLIANSINLTNNNNNNNIQSKFSHDKWTCKNDKCEIFTEENGESYSTLKTCKILCGKSPPYLWPKPKQLEILDKNSTTFQKERIFLKIYAPEETKANIEELSNIFLSNMIETNQSADFHLYDQENQILKLNLHVSSSSKVSENYTLYSQKLPEYLMVNLFADNYFGLRHGLETLSQLIWYDEISQRFRILHDVKIVDGPSFSHRGILIDVSRHFFPIKLLKKVVNGMAASKLNILHLHISDVESFPLVLPSNNKFGYYGAYSATMKYSATDIKDLVNYAKKRGIKIIMEIDAPSHVSPMAWSSDQILCDDMNIFRTTLNPDNPETLNDLEKIYKDLFELGTDSETFHIGNDEVITDCWKNTEAAKNFNFNIYNLWSNFSSEMMKRVERANNGTIPKNIVLWSSPLTDKYIKSLDYQKSLVVQFWFGQYEHILDNGYKIIFSTVGHWYLDCGFGPWRKTQNEGNCDPYTDWRKFYKYRPWNDYLNRMDQILGGEVCLWSEQVSVDDLETRLWPRSAAFAERVWTDPPIFDQDDVFRRFDFHSKRLKERGFKVAAIWSEICWQFPDKC